MGLIGKIALVVVVLLGVHFVDSTLPHRHHKGHRHGGDKVEIRQSGENAIDYKVRGRITCYGRGIDYLRPYLHTPIYPHIILQLVGTMDGGYYHLSTGTVFDLRGKVELMVRHQCEIDNLPPMARCAVPYYTTNIPIDLPDNGTVIIPLDIDLFKQKEHSTSDCLY